MNKLKLCNVHKLAIANEGEQRKPIHIPFGTWAYDDTIDQTLDREHAEAIAADLAGKIAAGEPGIPVYQGHPDVPEYAGKYPDKGALGWVKKILVNEDGMDLEVEWDRDPGKGFAWFSPYWVGDDPSVGPDGKRNVIIDGLTSIGLVNNPNIREFRLANEAGEDLTQRGGGAKVAAFKLPQHIIDLANEYDESKHPRGENGQWTAAGSAAALSAAQTEFDTAKSELIAGQKRGWSKAENDKAFRRYDRAEKKLREAKAHDKMIRASSGPGRPKQTSNIKDSDMIPHPVLKQQETKKKLDALWAELGRRFDERMALANVIDANGMGHSDENGQFDGSGSGGGASEETKGKLKKMLKFDAISVAAGGNPASAPKDAIHFEHRGKKYYVGKDSEHMVKQFEDAGLVKRISGPGGGSGASQSSRLDRMLGEARSGIAKAKESAAASRARRASGRAELEARIAEIRQKRLELKDFNDRMEKRIRNK